MRFTERQRTRRCSVSVTLIGAFALLLGLMAAPVHAHHTHLGQGGEGAATVHFQGIADPNNGVCTPDPGQGPPIAHGNHLGDPDDGKDGACLPVFPDTAGEDGDFDGDVTGSASGTDNGVPWSVVIDDGRIDADFSYAEPALTCPLEGTANGTFEIEDLNATGVYGTMPVTEAHATGRFAWTRAGMAVIEVFDVDLWLHLASGHVEQVLDDAEGSATATFDASPNATNCDGSSVTATVIGDGAFSSDG